MAGAQTGVLELPYEASGAIVKNRGVKLSGDQTVQQVAASNDRSLGVATVDVSSTEATAGKGVTVRVLGVQWCEAGAAVTRGDRVMYDTSGRVVLAATAGNFVIGYALKGTTTGAGDLIPVLLTPNLPAL